MKRAVIYARISQDRTGAHLGVSRQLSECEDFAQGRNIQVVDRLTDNDISAYSGKPRPGYEELLQRIRDGSVDEVLVWHTDRLHRSPKELEEYIDACSVHGVQTQTVKAGELDLATSTGRLIARQLGSLARYESEHKGERVKAKRRQAALAGQWQGGARPFGWQIRKETDEHGGVRNVPVIDETEAELVRWAFQAVLEGRPISSIVAHFQRSGVPSARGNEWRHSTVRSLLGKTRNCGIESLHGEELGLSTFPALVDEGTFRAVQRILKDPKRKSQDDNRVKHLLGGIAKCHCGMPMVAGNTGRGARQYVCESYRFPETRRKDISHVSRRLEELDAHVQRRWPHIIYGTGSALRLHAPGRAEDRQQVEKELTKLRAQQDELIDMWSEGSLTRRQFEAKNAEFGSAIDKLEDQLADLAQTSEFLPDLQPNQAAAYWETLDVLQKRALLKQSVEIICYPTGGKRFSKLENAWEYVRIEALPATAENQRIIYWNPTVEAQYDESDPMFSGVIEEEVDPSRPPFAPRSWRYVAGYRGPEQPNAIAPEQDGDASSTPTID
ncbi:recombinase family protein [Kocuria nitroreducens]|uniref:recombinase family protein n=1 Tax=Kocuria nitroreducens TaxID=3058914 RepID=UPI0036DB00EE